MSSECINVTARRIWDGFSISAINQSKELEIVADKANESIVLKALFIKSSFNVVCSIVCSINKSWYLNVNPNVIWLTPEELASANFDIHSNVTWEIN